MSQPAPERPLPLDDLLRELAPQVLGVLMRRYGNFDAAEDATQEALIAAADQWPHRGAPANPRAWLITVASRKLTDQWRSETARQRREVHSATLETGGNFTAPGADSDLDTDQDDSLKLMVLCCHPALTTPSQVALTLRAVGGLTTPEIARAFLVPESTMAQRISRAKSTVKSSGVPFQMPEGEEREESLRAVQQVLYLIFNEGYTATAGPALSRIDLTREAIRLTRQIRRVLPDDGEIAGLLALMLLTEARRDARSGLSGELIPLTEQDRSRWNRELIAEGVALLETTLATSAIGPYQIQAAIAALHDEAGHADATDWPQIAALYAMLQQIAPSPVISLNHAVAVGMTDGPEAGLRMLDQLESSGTLKETHRVDAVRAHLLEMSGNLPGAIASYRRAAARTASEPEQRYLESRAARLE